MKKPFLIVLWLLLLLSAKAEEVVYQLEEFNSTTQDFRLKSYGTEPLGSYALFWNAYGAVSGNRFNQIPKGREASLTLVGWEGCRIDSVTLSLCSNNKAGSLKLHVTAGDSVLFTMPTADFADSVWYGAWLSKDLGIYADITKCMTSNYIIGEDEDVVLLLKTGTRDGSVYVKRFVVYYTRVVPLPTQSAMGYVYEKLEKKSTLAEADTIILYRSGSAAGDVDGMASSHYLDALGVANTQNVCELGICHFVLHKQGSSWLMVTLEGDTLGAQGAQHLCWNAGVKTWDISLTYSGAQIASTNTKYGTLRYNAPATSYARFWNYTSTSLVLPYMYRRVRQNQPVQVSDVQLPTYRIGYLENDTIALKATILPKTATDERLRWQSNCDSVATVRNGIVYLHAEGSALITCTSWDGQHQAVCLVDVMHAPTALEDIPLVHEAQKMLRDGQVLIRKDGRCYDVYGKEIR